MPGVALDRSGTNVLVHKLMVYDSDDGVCLVWAGRKRSLRSLEIPLENLLSGIVFLSGEC